MTVIEKHISTERFVIKPNLTHESLQFATFKIRQSIYDPRGGKQLTRLHRTFNGFSNFRAGGRVYQTLSTLGLEHFISQSVVTFRLRLWWQLRLSLLDSLTPDLSPEANTHRQPEQVRKKHVGFIQACKKSTRYQRPTKQRVLSPWLNTFNIHYFVQRSCDMCTFTFFIVSSLSQDYFFWFSTQENQQKTASQMA